MIFICSPDRYHMTTLLTSQFQLLVFYVSYLLITFLFFLTFLPVSDNNTITTKEKYLHIRSVPFVA